MPELSYLDFAATSALRPPEVARAVADFIGDIGATSGRGGHRLAVSAGRVALRCRQTLARLLQLPGDPGRIAFMMNATHALNTALFGLLRQSDVLVVTALDHNSVLRPAHKLSQERAVEVRLVPANSQGELDMTRYERALDGARLVVLNAVSNVLGTTLDIAALSRLAHAAGALVLVDGAQAAGHMPFTPAADGADLVALTGHKGLLGPQGIGALWVREGIDVAPLITGGTGGNSLERDMPRPYPDHLEAGTTNGPGIAGLSAGMDWLLAHNVAHLHQHTASLKAELRDGLAAIPGVHVRSPAAPNGGAIVTIVTDDVDPATLAARLDREHEVLVRPGLHCAPEAHLLIGTANTGAVRFSLGWCSERADVERALRGVHSILHSRSVAQPVRAAAP
jgi:selenocysteine lyase/cysteine desulfurase